MIMVRRQSPEPHDWGVSSLKTEVREPHAETSSNSLEFVERRFLITAPDTLGTAPGSPRRRCPVFRQLVFPTACHVFFGLGQRATQYTIKGNKTAIQGDHRIGGGVD
jgi:hypothetical protein